MLTGIRIENTHAILHAYELIDRFKKFAKNSIYNAEDRERKRGMGRERERERERIE
jgi:hypothetical protein